MTPASTTANAIERPRRMLIDHPRGTRSTNIRSIRSIRKIALTHARSQMLPAQMRVRTTGRDIGATAEAVVSAAEIEEGAPEAADVIPGTTVGVRMKDAKAGGVAAEAGLIETGRMMMLGVEAPVQLAGGVTAEAGERKSAGGMIGTGELSHGTFESVITEMRA